MRSMSGYRTNVPAVTPAPKPTISTDFGFGWNSAGRCPSMRCSRMSYGSVEASTLPLTWNCTAPSSHCEMAMEELMPSPVYRIFERLHATS